MPTTSLAARLQRLSDSSPELELFYFLKDGVRVSEALTCAELDRRARTIAARLRESITEGDRVLLLYSSGLDFIATIFGCFYARVIAVPCAKPRPSAEDEDWRAIARIGADCQPAMMLTDSAEAERFWVAQCNAPTSVICTTHIADHDDPADKEIPLSSITSDQIAFLQYTSGSTGDPKGAVITHGNIVSNLAAMDRLFLSEVAAGVTWLPMHHDMGLIGTVFSAVWIGRPLYVMSPFSMLKQPFHWLDAISRYRATISPAPNFAFEYCVQRVTDEQKARLDLSCWKIACVGAEPVHVRTLERFYDAFKDCGFGWESFYPCYGLAEATLFVSGGLPEAAPIIRSPRSHSGDRPETANSLVGCGYPAEDSEVLIVDPITLIPRPAGETGEIWLKGASVAKGYWNRPLETAETFGARPADSVGGPFLRTGDLGFFDAQELFITGRLKDVIVIRGRNHFAGDLERTAAAAHPAIADRTTVAFSRIVDGEEQLIILQEVERRVLIEETSAIRAAITNALLDRHGLKTSEICFVRSGTLPKTTSGKIRRNECQRRYGLKALDFIEERV